MAAWNEAWDEDLLPCCASDVHLGDCPLRSPAAALDPGDLTDAWYSTW